MSTGRCGTQSLTKIVKDSLGDSATVTHEPIGALYKPKYTMAGVGMENAMVLEAAMRHFEAVVSSVSGGMEYVETGWPSFTWYEKWSSSLGDKWRFIYLTRNPVHVAASFVTHGYYTRERSDEYTDFAILQPTDPGVSFPEIAAEWDTLTLFDKCLYQWLEINTRAFQLMARGILPVSAIRFEELFASDAARRELFGKLDWPTPPRVIDGIDKFHFGTDRRLRLTSHRIWERVEKLAGDMGYSRQELLSALQTTDYRQPRIPGKNVTKLWGNSLPGDKARKAKGSR
ncbi:hypothetical protein [Aestuariivirga sp.]|uniref:hypothetical protein n=1 Tax=Aestuariivirga sp. TaxID=2650926 RepID=UPI00391BFEBB